jgi:glutathione S-transferase
MILVGRYRSPFTRRVAVTLHLTGIPFERRIITAWDALDAVTVINPAGRVPALILDDGEAIAESSFIIDYLDHLAGPDRALTPPAGPERFRVQQLVALAMGAMDKIAMVVYEVRERPPETRHQPWLERNQQQVMSAFSALDQVVPSPWLTGDTMTQADATVGVLFEFVCRVDPTLIPDGRFANLEALTARCDDLPAFKETLPEP